MTAVPARPKLRRVEAFPAANEGGEPIYLVRDPCGLAEGVITLSPTAMFILTLMDGEHSLLDVQEVFARHYRQLLPRQQLEDMVHRLDEAHFLDSPAFVEYFQSLVETYRAAPARISGGEGSFGAEPGQLGTVIQRMLFDGQEPPSELNRNLVGLVAPHLDYPRGTPGYCRAYRLLAAAEPPRRVVVLGTNHSGQACAPVATRKDFQTPLGMTKTDRAFIEGLEKRLGVDLCEHELDHQREHSVELQLLILQHLLGSERFDLVPVLLPDICGSTGTTPFTGKGADVRDFGEALGELIRADGTPTLIVAGADLSHVGRQFGDERDLDEPFLREVEQKDRQALDALVNQGCEAFAEAIRNRENDTRVCSAGCIYAMMTALPGTKAELLAYHQTADRESGTGVTCAAVAVWRE